jgi:hypothetical protein
MNEPKTRLDRLNARIRDNPIVASLIILGTVVIALSTFTNAARNLWSLVAVETRADINGNWIAEVTYAWQNTRYTETFTFSGDGEEVYGTASFLGLRRGILEGKTKKGRLQFTIKTHGVLGDWNNPKEVVHRYQGKVLRDEISFVMQTEDSFTEHPPIEFTAQRMSDKTTR